MKILDPLGEFGHDDVETILLPLTMGFIPSKLPLAGIALGFIFIPDMETGNIFLSRFCKEISENEEEILSYLRGAKTEEWAHLANMDIARYFTLVDSRIASFGEFEERAGKILGFYSNYHPLQSIVNPLEKVEGKSIPIEVFSKRVMYASGIYSKEFIRILDTSYQEVFGYLFPPGNYGPVGYLRQAHRLVRDIIVDVVSDFENGIPLQVVRNEIEKRAFPLIPIYIEADDRNVKIDVDEIIRLLGEASSPIEMLQVMRDNPVLVSDLIYFSMPEVIRVQNDIGFIENANVLKRCYGYIKNLRSALRRTTPNYEDVPKRMNCLVNGLQDIMSKSEAEIVDVYKALLKEFPESASFLAANQGNFDFQDKFIDLPDAILALISEAEKIFDDKMKAENYFEGLRVYESILERISLEQQPLQWAYISNLFSIRLSEDNTNSRRKHLEKAIELLEKALEIMPRIDQLDLTTFEQGEILWGSIHGHLGKAYSNRLAGDKFTNSQRAFYHLTLALKFFHEIKHPEGWAISQVNLGSAYADNKPENIQERTRFLARAIVCFNNALKVFTQVDHPRDWARLNLNINAALSDLGMCGLKGDDVKRLIIKEERLVNEDKLSLADLEKGFKQHGLEIQEELEKSIEEATISFSNDVQAHVEADVVSKLTPIIDKIPADDQAEFFCNRGIALQRSKEGDHKENVQHGIEYLHRALEIYETQNNLMDWARTHYNIGTGYLDLLLNAQEFSLGEILADRFGFPRPFNKTNDFPKVIEHYTCALKVLTPETEPVLARRMGQRIGDLNLQLQDWPRAVDGYSVAIDADSALYQDALLQVSKDKVLAETDDIDLQEAGHLYSNASFALAKVGRIKEALNVIEMGKARRIRETLGYQELALLNKEDKDEALAISNEIQRVQKIIEDAHSSRPANEIFQLKTLEELIHRRKKVINRIRGNAPHIFQDTFDYKEIVKALPRKTAIIELAITTQGSVAFLLSRSAVPFRTTFEAIELNGLNIRNLRTASRGRLDGVMPGSWLGCLLRRSRDDPSDNPFTARPLARLYDFQWFLKMAFTVNEEFWKKVDRFLQNKEIENVIFVLQDDLKLFPMHASIIGKNEREFSATLGRYKYSYAPSALTWYKARIRPHGELEDAVVLADPTGLRFVELETWIVADMLRFVYKSVRVLDGSKMEKGALLESIKRTNLLHYCGHAEYKWGNPSESGLGLAKTRKIRLKDIWSPNFFPNLNLAVLSGCTTTMFDFQPSMSDEYIGLPSAFISSGAKAVIGSLWKVEDLAALIFSVGFYRTWLGAKPLSIASAMAETQKWMKTSKPHEYIELLQKYRERCQIRAQSGDEFSIHVLPIFKEAINDLKERGESPFDLFDWATFQVIGDAL
ncbi:CHAT domain-containing protein [bacterium]|nr:CHAT domain-containing protein [bacterium]